MKRLIIIAIFILPNLILAQDYFLPLNVKTSFEKGTRSFDGKPGENYWQNTADYKIKIKFNPYEKLIDGTETIKYFNNSPDSLGDLVIRLYQNFYRKNSARNFQISSESVTDGVELNRLMINNESIILDDNSSVNFTNTNLIIKLSDKIQPHSSVDITVDWKFTIPAGSPIRMGIYDSTSFLIAYWYPQIAVYDDIDGWDKIDFNGEQEMYNDFNNYDVEIETPDKFFVWSTGILQNAGDILCESIFNKFETAHTSDSVINIITKDDFMSGNKLLLGSENNIWHFKADNVTDFAFGCSDHYLWDAISLMPYSNSNRRVFISAAYNPESKDFYGVAEIARNALQYFSTDLPGVPFPYPSFTVFNGGGGMEFPMIINDGSSSTLAGTVYLTAHEAAHSYFPFYMGINEKKYAWMDEGMAVMLPIKFQSQVENSDPVSRNANGYASFSGREMEIPLIVPSILLRGSSYRVASYQRPGLAYYYLQDFLGRDTFRKALQEYMRRWNGKHPIPYDFFNTFNNYLGRDLSWFWKPWFFEFGFPDLAIKSYHLKNNLLEIEVEKIGNIPVPIKLTLLKDSESVKEIYNAADVWSSGKKIVKIKLNNPGDFDKIVLGDTQIPDVNKENNELRKK
jgi:hypothetical protein